MIALTPDREDAFLRFLGGVFGALPGATHQAEANNPLCGDHFTVYLRLDGDRAAAAPAPGADQALRVRPGAAEPGEPVALAAAAAPGLEGAAVAADECANAPRHPRTGRGRLNMACKESAH